MIPIAGWVAPFGYPWINACSRLPMAFRSVPRPSSPPGAKASTERPSLALSYATFEAKPQTSHLAQEPSNPSFNVQDLSPSTGSHRMNSLGSLQCRLIPDDCENNHLTETDAPSSTSILFTPLNTSGCGDLDRSHDPPPVRLATGASRRAKP